MADYNIQMKRYQSASNTYDNLNPKPMSHASTHASNGTDPITPANIGAIPTSQKGVANGVASLNSSGKVPTAQLPSVASTQKVTLTVSGWSLVSGRYRQVVNVTGITTTTPVIIVDCDLDTDDTDARIAILEGWAGPSVNEVDQGNGTLTFYSAATPAVNIPVNVGVV